MHAYVDATHPGPMTVEAFRDGGDLVVVISDEGRGVLPRPDSPGLGLGLSLIAQHLELSERAPSGTSVRMTFDVAHTG